MAHPNEELLRKMDEAQGKGDVETMMSFFADDVIVHIGGKNKVAGDKKGKQELMQSFGTFMQAMGEEAQFETHDIVAGDKHGFILQTFSSNKGWKPIEVNGIGIFHFAGGKISEAWFLDEDPYKSDAWYDAAMSS